MAFVTQPSPVDSVRDLLFKLLQGFADGTYGTTAALGYLPHPGDSEWDVTRKLLAGFSDGSFTGTAHNSYAPAQGDSLYNLTRKLLQGFADGAFSTGTPAAVLKSFSPGDSIWQLYRKLLQGFADGSFTGSSVTPEKMPSPGDKDWDLLAKLSLGFYSGTFSISSTPACVNVPLAPTNLGVLTTTTSAISFDWSQPLNIPPAPVGSYIVRWGATSGNYNLGNVTIPAAPQAYIITGLSSSETVYIVVQAIGADGCPGGTSAESSFATDVALSDNLVALWPMDEDVVSGTRVDVINGNNLADDNARIPAARGLMNGCALFTNGQSDSLSHADNADLGMGAGVSFTLVGWVMGTAVNTGWIGERSAGGTVDYVYSPQTGAFSVTDLGGTLRTVMVAPANNNQWHMFAIGFDSATGLMWQQFDGGARSTLAISGVRKSGQPFRITMDYGNVDQVGLWKRALTLTEVTQLFNNRFGLKFPFTSTAGQQYADTWSWAVQHNGGAAPSAGTVTAYGTFVDGLITDSTISSMIYVLPFAPDSLIAAATPVYTTWILGASYFTPSGGDPAVNHSFVGGDLTVNGMTGDASTKYFDARLIPSGSLSSIDSAALFCYVYSTSSAAQTDMGIYTPGNLATMLLTANQSGSSVGAMGLNGMNVSAAAKGNGYFCISRTSSTLITGYFANSSNVHASFASNTGSNAGAALSAVVVPIFALNVAGVGIVNFANSTISAAGVAVGLSSGDSALLYARLQTLRATLGGGFR